MAGDRFQHKENRSREAFHSHTAQPERNPRKDRILNRDGLGFHDQHIVVVPPFWLGLGLINFRSRSSPQGFKKTRSG